MKEIRSKRNASFKDRLLYYFDLWLSRGTFATILLLFVVTGILILLIGILATLIGGHGDSLGKSLWDTMNHTFDPGVLSGDDGSKVFLFLMLLATLIGVFFLALLIGLINDGIQGRVKDLSKGIEAIIESNHVIILGFNESTFIILEELVEAYKNQVNSRNVVVVMDQFPKSEMEDRIRMEIPGSGNLTIVCRSGSISSSKDLRRCSVETCKSIIIVANDDFETIKSILACTKMLNAAEDSEAYITSVIYKRENEHAARISGNDSIEETNSFSVKNDRLELLLMENTVSKIMTHTCRQNGLSTVFTELFNFAGYELYIARREKNKVLYDKMTGKSIRQINRCLPDSIAVGIITEDGSVLIDDPNNVLLAEGCQLILLEEDDDTVIPVDEQTVAYLPPVEQYQTEPSSILIIGCNEKLPYILREMCKYLSAGTIVYLASDSDELDRWLTDEVMDEIFNNNTYSAIQIQRMDSMEQAGTKNRKIDIRIDNHNYIYELLDECDPQYVLTLSPDGLDDDKADELALKLLLYCKHYKEMHPEADFGITCEMKSIVNQQLAQDSMASDFVISRNIASLMMAQIAENRELRGIFETLLSSEGFEIYMKPAKYYFSTQPGEEIDFYSVQEAVAEKGEIFLGYKKKTPNGDIIRLNPDKWTDGRKARMAFTNEDELVVAASDIGIMDYSES